MKTPIKLCAHRKTANSKKGHLIKTKNQRAMAHFSGLATQQIKYMQTNQQLTPFTE